MARKNKTRQTMMGRYQRGNQNDRQYNGQKEQDKTNNDVKILKG